MRGVAVSSSQKLLNRKIPVKIMKPTSITFIVLGTAVATGTILFLSSPKTVPAPAPAAESTASQTAEPTRQQNTVEAKAEYTAATSDTPSSTVSARPMAPVQAVVKSDELTNSTAFDQAIQTMVSPQSTFQQKQDALKQLRTAGQLDQAIAALKQGATDHPASAEYPAALGQADLQMADVILKSGGKISDMGILGMQADQSFDAALKLDPSNWAAQFFKAASMSYWPAELNKGEEVVQRLSSLIDQQETMAAQPEFAQAYVVLGTQFQKMNQPDKAQATWLLGAQKFPNDPALQAKINGQ